jgi:hypothetical protein
MAMATLTLGKHFLTSLKVGVSSEELTEAQNAADGWVRSHLEGLYNTSGWTSEASTPTVPRTAARYFGSSLILEGRFMTDSGHKAADKSVFDNFRKQALALIEQAKAQPLFLDGSAIPVARREGMEGGPISVIVRPDFPEEAGQLFRIEHEQFRESEELLERDEIDLYSAGGIPPC